MEKFKHLTPICSFVGGVLAACFGLLWPWVQLMLGAMVLDYLTGMAAACYLGQLSSRAGLRGILKKLGLFVMVAVGMIADRVLGEGAGALGFQGTPVPAVALTVTIWIILNELISILENLGRMEVRLPDFLHSIIQSLHQKLQRLK